MSIKKVTLASVILLSLTACSSGGGGGSGSASPANKPAVSSQTTSSVNTAQTLPATKTSSTAASQDATEQAQSAEEHKKTEAAEQAQLAEERKKAEAAEQARLAEERKKAEAAEQARLAEEHKKAEAAEQARLAEERKKAEAAEQARLEEERKAILKENGMSLGLKGSALDEFVEKSVLVISDSDRQVQVELAMDLLGKSQSKDANGLQVFFDNDLVQKSLVSRSVLKYSATASRLVSQDGKTFEYAGSTGLNTQPDALPTTGQARYTGLAFRGDLNGLLSYDVNFATKKGQGVVEALDGGVVWLDEGKISGNRISSTARMATSGLDDRTGSYKLGFYGPNAEEIGGELNIKQWTKDEVKSYGLAGSRRAE